MTAIAQEHPYTDIPEAVRRAIPVTDFMQIHDILSSRDFAMAGREQSLPFFMGTIMVKEGSEHSQRRRTLAKHFRPAFLLEQLNAAAGEALRLYVDPPTEAARRGEPVVTDLVDLVMRLQTLIMARFVGLSLGNDPRAAIDDLVQRMPLVNLSGALLWSRNDSITEIDRVRHAMVEFNDRYVTPAITSYRKDPSGAPPTLIATLCDAFDPATSDGEYIAREARVFLTAGVRTTAYAIIDTVPHLIEWFAKAPHTRAQALDPTDNFLIRAVSEGLRLHAPNPAIMRRAAASGVTEHGVTYEAGQMFALYTGYSHLDSRVFGPHPEAFNPDRVPTEGIPLWGHAFAHGHHACIGRALALGRPQSEDGVRSYEGTTATILRRLIEVGLDYAPGQSPTYLGDTFKTMCQTFPVVLGAGPTEEVVA